MATTVANLLERNKAAAASHQPLPTISELRASGRPPPKTMIEVVVHRNAGGKVSQALRDITIIDQLFKLDELAIIHYTDCGNLAFTDQQMRASLKGRVEEAHWKEIDNMEFGAITNLEESVKEDLKWVRSNPLIREELKKGCQGFVFDIKSGNVEKIGA